MCPSNRSLRPTFSVTSDFRPAFEVLDADRDGKISGEDLRMVYGGFSDRIGEMDEVIGAMISVADGNKNGFVEYDDFELFLQGYIGKNRKCNGKNSVNGGVGVMEEVFRVMDRDGDGRLSVDDLKSYMEWAGFCASDEDIEAMIRFGRDDDNMEGVSFVGLLNIFGLVGFN